MTRYKVVVTYRAAIEIIEYADYIAQQSGSWRVAEEWMQRVYDAIDSLDYLPNRYELAEESKRSRHNLRRILIGKYVANYQVEEVDKVVRVVAFRHGARLPRRGDLPDDPNG